MNTSAHVGLFALIITPFRGSIVTGLAVCPCNYSQAQGRLWFLKQRIPKETHGGTTYVHRTLCQNYADKGVVAFSCSPPCFAELAVIPDEPQDEWL